MNESTHSPITDPGDLLCHLPVLHGYVPHDSVTLTLVSHGVLAASVCIPLDDVGNPDVEAMMQQFLKPGDRVLMVGWCGDQWVAVRAMEELESRLPSVYVLDQLWTDGTWWQGLDAEGCIDTEQRHRAEEFARQRGMTVLTSRDELACQLAGPPAPEMAVRKELCDALYKQWGGVDPLEWESRALGLVSQGMHRELSRAECLELAVLVSDIQTRDAALVSIDRRHAMEQFEVWRQVVAQTPDGWVVPPLCLAGLAGWVGGNGAILNLALERAMRHDPHYRLVRVMEEFGCHAVSPSLWDEIRSELT